MFSNTTVAGYVTAALRPRAATPGCTALPGLGFAEIYEGGYAAGLMASIVADTR